MYCKTNVKQSETEMVTRKVWTKCPVLQMRPQNKSHFHMLEIATSLSWQWKTLSSVTRCRNFTKVRSSISLFGTWTVQLLLLLVKHC